MSYVNQQLRSQGNANPPGRAVAPGQPMPAYKNVPGKEWMAARGNRAPPSMPKTNTHKAGNMLNMYVTSAKVTKPWSRNDQDNIREGQIGFVGRTITKGDNTQMSKIATMQHMNDICTRAYSLATQRLREGRVPDGISITLEQFTGINAINIFEYLGKEHLIENDPVLFEACKLLKYKEFKYLLPEGFIYHWNLFGAVNNISVGTSPEARMDQSLTKTIVANFVVNRAVFISNIWGGPDKVVEGSIIGLIVRRGMQEDGSYGGIEIIPWAEKDRETPAFCDRGYFDEGGNWQLGHFIRLGKVLEVEARQPAEQKRRQAIGEGGKHTRGRVHDALGGLPRLRVQWDN